MFNLCNENDNTRHSLTLYSYVNANNKLIVSLKYNNDVDDNISELVIAEIDNVTLGEKIYNDDDESNYKELCIQGNDIQMLKMIDKDIGDTELPTAESENNCISFLLSEDGRVLIYINKDGKLKIKYKNDTLKSITGIDGGYASRLYIRREYIRTL